MLSGTNFGAGTNVRVYWGTAATGTLLVTGTTDVSGNLASSLSFGIPAGTQPGTYPVTAEDNASWYPVTAAFDVVVVPQSPDAVPRERPRAGRPA